MDQQSSKEHQGVAQTRSTTKFAEETLRMFAWAPNAQVLVDYDDDFICAFSSDYKVCG